MTVVGCHPERGEAELLRMRIGEVVEALGAVRVPANVFNQYSHTGRAAEANAIRRHNLLLYFEQMLERKPDTVLIGEAVSYRGGRLTGIPFVSESILLCGIHSIGMFGTGRGYRKTAEWERVSTEASATIVWATIPDFQPLPLLWNAFPFHPFRSGDSHTNRMPGRAELEIGQPFISALLDLFRIQRVIAVGNQADLSLTLLGIAHAKVRHPSQGGKIKFVDGLRNLLGLADLSDDKAS